jgi:hypothetical protein
VISANLFAKLAACGSLLLLTACSTVYEGRYDFADGWREGTVAAVLSQEQLERQRVTRCKGPGIQTDDAWIVVRYVRSGHFTTFAVPAPRGRFSVEQKVYVNPGRDCADAIAQAN